MNEIFSYNQHFVAMMNIINAARLNPPKKGHMHHIVPRCWFKMNNIPVDNSKNNLVLLSIEDHQKVHRLAALCAATPEMKSKMGFAVHILRGTFSGLHHTEESKKKMSAATKGKPKPHGPISEEQKKKISDSMKGKPRGSFSDEHKRKLSEATKGERNPMYGKTQSEETKRKISESMKGRTPWNKGV